MTVRRCEHHINQIGGECGDRAEWLISNGQWPMDVAMCGMHSMRYKEPDGFTRYMLSQVRG